MPSDETLAARAAAGDDSAFEELVRRYQARVFRLACRITTDTDAPDVLQETFLQVYRNLPSFRGESQFGTWVYRIATNAALMHRRSSARRPADSLESFLPRIRRRGKAHGDSRRTSGHRARRRSPRSAVPRRKGSRRHRAAAGSVPDAFVLRDLEGLGTSDVARILGVEPATVRQRVHRARLMLRGYLAHLVEVQQ